MRIGCKTGGPGDGVSYRGSHGQTVRVGRSAILAFKQPGNSQGMLSKGWAVIRKIIFRLPDEEQNRPRD